MPFGLQDVGAMVDMSGWDEAAGYPAQHDDTGVKTIKSLVHRIQKNVNTARDHAYGTCCSWLIVASVCWVVYRGWEKYFMTFRIWRLLYSIRYSSISKGWGS